MRAPIARAFIASAACALLAMHTLLALTLTHRPESLPGAFHVYPLPLYESLSLGNHALASRLLTFRALLTPENRQIESADAAKIAAALRTASLLDPANIQPYQHAAFYWIWIPSPEGRRRLANYLTQAETAFPNRWEFPYAVYRYLAPIAPADALPHLKTAALTAARTGEAPWLLDLPSILMKKNGEIEEAVLWLKYLYEHTTDPEYQRVIGERMFFLMESRRGMTN